MSKVCQVTGKRTVSGNNVSHSNRKTRRRFMPNLHERRFWVASENRWVKLRVSAAALRTIDKNGIDAILADLRKFHDTVLAQGSVPLPVLEQQVRAWVAEAKAAPPAPVPAAL